MASKKKQVVLKRRSACEASGETGSGKPSSSRLETAEPVTSDQDSEQELERNFAVFSKQGASQTGKDREPDAEDDDYGQSSDEDEEEDAGEEAGASADGDEDDEEEKDVEEAAESSDGEAESDSDSEDTDGDSDEPTQSGVKNDGKLQSEEDVKRELSTMSFEDIMELQNKVGTKVYNEVAYGTQSRQVQERKKRLNKNRPTEISAKRRAPFLRQVVSVKKSVLRDPRFDDLSGEYKPEIFEKTYGFIQDIKRKEMQVVQKRLRSVKSAKKKEQLELLMKRMVNQEKAHQRQQLQREKELEMKRRHREMVGDGQRPFYLKKSDQRRLELADKYGELKRSGKLDNFLSKKRKRNAAKDRRKLPFQPMTR